MVNNHFFVWKARESQLDDFAFRSRYPISFFFVGWNPFFAKGFPLMGRGRKETPPVAVLAFMDATRRETASRPTPVRRSPRHQGAGPSWTPRRASPRGPSLLRFFGGGGLVRGDAGPSWTVRGAEPLARSPYPRYRLSAPAATLTCCRRTSLRDPSTPRALDARIGGSAPHDDVGPSWTPR